jgi:hypothetical protein
MPSELNSATTPPLSGHPSHSLEGNEASPKMMNHHGRKKGADNHYTIEFRGLALEISRELSGSLRLLLRFSV